MVVAPLPGIPGLVLDYDYFDGEVSVYGIKGHKFEPDALFTNEIVDKIKQLLIQGWSSGEKTGIWDTIVQEALEAGIAWKEQRAPDQAGVHPENRGTFGVDGHNSQCLGGDILSVGWSWQKCSDATSVSAPPEPWLTNPREFNEELASLSGGLIPQLKLVGVLTLGGGHTNTFLRQTNGRVRSVVKKLEDKDGLLNPETLSVGRSQFKIALEKGLVFVNFHWQTPFFFPSLPAFAQGALNTKIAGGQGEIEMMLTLHGLARQQMVDNPDQKVDWQPLEEIATKTFPTCASWISSISAWVEQNGGGPEGTLVHELADYAKAFSGGGKAPARIIGGEFLSKLIAISFGPGPQFPYVKTAVLEAQLASPANKTQNGQCKLIQVGALSELSTKKNREQVVSAEDRMTEARKLVKALGLSTSDRIRFVGLYDVRLILFILGKGKDFEARQFKTMDAITKVPMAIVLYV